MKNLKLLISAIINHFLALFGPYNADTMKSTHGKYDTIFSSTF